MYGVCYPGSVSKWEPITNFKKFIIKANAGENFVKVNNRVKKVCDDIDEIISDLTTLKTKMDVNEEMNSEIDRTIKELQKKREDIIKKNQELYQAATEVLEYVMQNKASKAEEANNVVNLIQKIDVYNG